MNWSRKVYKCRYYSYNMRITKKVVKIAQSLGVIIDKPIIEKMKIKEGDYVEIDIKLIGDLT
jgi:hypothetical protein